MYPAITAPGAVPNDPRAFQFPKWLGKVKPGKHTVRQLEFETKSRAQKGVVGLEEKRLVHQSLTEIHKGKSGPRPAIRKQNRKPIFNGSEIPVIPRRRRFRIPADRAGSSGDELMLGKMTVRSQSPVRLESQAEQVTPG